MWTRTLRIFCTVILLELTIIGSSLTQEVPSSTVAKDGSRISNNTLVQDTAEKAFHKILNTDHHAAALGKTNLDDTSTSKDKLHEQNEFILSEHESVNSRDDSSTRQEDIVIFTSVVTSRSVLIHERDGVTRIRPVLHDGQILIEQTTSTPLTTPKELEPSEVVEIDEEVIKEVDNTEDMSKLLGEVLPTKIVNGEEQELTPSMEEIFEDHNENEKSVDKINDKDKMRIIDEWMKQKEDKDLDVPTMNMLPEVPQLSVITNEDNLDLQIVENVTKKNDENIEEANAKEKDNSTDVPIDTEIVQHPVKLSTENFEPSKGSTELPNTTEVLQVELNEANSINFVKIEDVSVDSVTIANTLDEVLSTTTAKTVTDVKITTANLEVVPETTTDLSAKLVISPEIIDVFPVETLPQETTKTEVVPEATTDLSGNSITSQETVSDQSTANSGITVPLKSTNTASPVDSSTLTTPSIKLTTENSQDFNEDDSLKVVPLREVLLPDIENVGSSVREFISGTTKDTSDEISTETATESIDLLKDKQIKLINIMDQIKKEIKEQKEELEYFEDLMRGTTIVPQIFTSKPKPNSKNTLEVLKNKSQKTDFEHLKVVPLGITEGTTESTDATVVFTTKLLLTGFVEHVNDVDLVIGGTSSSKMQANFNETDNGNMDLTTESTELLKELNIVPMDRVQIDPVNKDMNIDVIIAGDKEVEVTSIKYKDKEEKSSSTQSIKDLESTIQDSVESTTVLTTRASPNSFEFHHQTLDESISPSTTSKPIVITENVPPNSPKRPLSITELVKQALGNSDVKDTQPTSEDGNDSREHFEGIDYDYDSQEKLTMSDKPVGMPSKELVDSFQSPTPEAVPSIEAIDYASSEEDFPPFTREFSHPSHFPRIFSDGFDQSFEESRKVPVIVKGDKPTTISYRSVIDNDDVPRGGLQDVITQAVLKGLNAVKAQMEQVKKEIQSPFEGDDDENNEAEILDEVLVQNNDIVSQKQVVEDPIQDLSYDSAETDKEVKEIEKQIEEDRKLTMIHRDLYFDEDLTSYLSVNFSMKITVNGMDYLIPESVNLEANNSESTVFLQLAWPSSNANGATNSLTFKLEKGQESLQIDGLVMDMHLTTSDGIEEHLQLEKSWLNIVEWTQGEFEIKMGSENILHIAYLDLVLNEKADRNGLDSATFQQKLTSGTALLIISVTFGSSVILLAFGYLIYIKCRSKANVFKVDLP